MTERKRKNKILGPILSFLLFASVIGVFILNKINLSFVIILVLCLYYLKYIKKKKEPDFLSLAFLFVFSLFSILLTAHFDISPYFSLTLFLVILVNVLYSDVEFSFIFLLVVCLLNTLIYGLRLDLFIIYFVSGATGIFLTKKVRTRFDIIKSGILAGLVQFIMILSFMPEVSVFKWGEPIKFSLASGLFSFVVIAVLPIFEYLLGVVTNISLLELSDFNHPLLRKMILEAPGTYQHSLVVANLAEAAAESIGRNSLLTRVGAYYHDIGKISKAGYFSENQMVATYTDRHKNLTPAMSRMIIMNHVKEGISLAKKFKLNKRIVDFITEHHGTTLVYYFFRRAREEKPKDAEPEEGYRYPGPKPQSKEVALVHLADSVEARSKTLEEPTPSRIKEMVKDTIFHKFLDGQLNDTDLTLRDLEKVTEVFTRILNAMFHTRIDYSKNVPNYGNKKKQIRKSSKNKG